MKISGEKTLVSTQQPGNGAEVTDASLLRRIAEGKQGAWETLSERYAPLVYAICWQTLKNKHDAEDATQDVFVRIYKYAAKFRYGESAKSWIGTMASRVALKMAMKKSKTEKVVSAMENDTYVEESQPEAPWEQSQASDDKHLLRHALMRLPDRIRQPIIMYYVNEMRQSEIAKVLLCDRTTVIDRIKKGLNMLRGELAQTGMMAPGMALPALIRQCLFDTPLPASLLHRLYAIPGLTPASSSPHSAKAKPALKWGAAGAAVSAATVVAAVVFIAQNKTEPLPDEHAAASARFSVAYDFTETMPPDFEKVYPSGNETGLRVIPGKGLHVPPGHRLGLVFPVQLPAVPVVLESRSTLVGKDMGLIRFALANDNTTSSFNRFGTKHIELKTMRQTIHMKHYFFDRYTVRETPWGYDSVLVYNQAYPADRLLMILDNINLESVRIREIDPDGMPETLRDPMALARSLSNEPQFFATSPVRYRRSSKSGE